MIGRTGLSLLLVAAVSGGCAAMDERLSRIESAVLGQELRIAALEDAVHVSTAAPLTQTAAVVVAEPGVSVPAERDPAFPPRRERAVSSSVNPPTNPPVIRTTTQARQAMQPSPVERQRPTAPAPGRAALARPSGSAARDYQKALSTLESGRPREAESLFIHYLQNHPGTSLTPNAGYWLGECYYSQKRYEQAIDAFKDVVAQYPSHPKAAAAMLKAGYSYAQLGDAANARFYLQALLKDYPGSAPAPLARSRLASL